jgi:DNA-binding NtrC family response regulator
MSISPVGGTIVKIHPPMEDHAASNPATSRHTQRMSSFKILVVEDEEDLRSVTAAGLRRHGYAVYEAASAIEALEIVERVPDLALVFTDVLLGAGIDGFQLVQAVIQKRPEIRAILTSGYAAADQLPANLHAHGVVFLNKPYRIDTVVSHVAEFIGQPDTPLRVASAAKRAATD